MKMNHQELYLQNEPSRKRQKADSESTRNISNSNSSMIGMPYDDNTPLPLSSASTNIPFSSKHNNTTPSTCVSHEIRKNLTIGKPLNVYDFKSNFNTTSASTAQRSSEKSDHHHERKIGNSVSEQTHINDLPDELLLDTFDTSKRWRQ